MLRNSRKNDILQEERYRREIAVQLDSASRRTTKNAVWDALNSAFCLWLLSTVVVGFISWRYTQWEKHREADRIVHEQAAIRKREDGLTLRKLDAEIASRLQFVHSVIRLSNPSHEAVLSVLRALENPSHQTYSVNVFPEYSARSLRSLLWELVEVLPEGTDPSERHRILVASERARLLPTIYVLAEQHAPSGGGNGEVRPAVYANLTTVMQTFFDLERWGFPFSWEKGRRRLKLPDEGAREPPVKSQRSGDQ